MAGLALFLGQGLPVFASETTAPTRFDDILVYSGTSGAISLGSSLTSPNAGTCISMTELYNRTDAVDEPTDPNASPNPIVHAVYHTPYYFSLTLSDLISKRIYYGSISVRYNLTWSFSVANWSRNASCIAYYSGSPYVSVALDGNYLQFDIDIDSLYSSSTSSDIICYVVIESSYRCGNKSYAQSPITMSQTSSLITTSCTLTSRSGYIYESNATPAEIAQSEFLNQWTVIQNQNALYNWATGFQSQQAIFNGNLLTNLATYAQVNHNDLQTIHHDLTDVETDVADAQSEAAAAQSDAAAAESEFNSYADPEELESEFDDAFSDSNNPFELNMNLSESLGFWWELTDRFFEVNDSAHANYPVYIQIFLNFLGRLW